MALSWKRLNSEETMYATWSDDSDKPDKMPDGSEIPINNFGINVKTLDIYYWDGNVWQQTQ